MTKTGEVRYKAWGEDRHTSGSSPTSYRFTGQRVESYINLYWYGSRWYDSALGRFVSPDPIIPDPYNPLAYDRYQYVYSNPVRFNDPSGHVACDGKSSGDECSSSRWSFTSSELEQAIKYEYKWKVIGSWSREELEVIYKTGNDIETYVNGLTYGNGVEWMNKYLGGTRIIHAPISGYDGGRPFAVINTVFLEEGWLMDNNPNYIFAHEQAHIWDDNSGNTRLGPSTWSGGGVSDALAKYAGGNPYGLRWANGISGIPPSYQWPEAARDGYGNTSTTDYFAEAFAWMIYDHSLFPQPNILFWTEAVISLQGR